MKDSKKTSVNITIYSTPTCPYCHMAKEFLSQNGVAYTDYNVAENEEKRNEMINKSGQMGVPVIDVNGEVMVGFDQGRLADLAGIDPS
jgi:glutaredoxin 3